MLYIIVGAKSAKIFFPDENFNDLIEASKNFDIPIVLVRPHGLEEVPESLEKEASTIVGWNANCIVDAIKNAEEIGRI